MFRSRLICLLAVMALVVPFLIVKQASAQAVYGSILGTITDAQGASVKDAKVTVTNQSKGTVDTTTTNESGNYAVSHLIPDTYTVKIEAAGFKSSEQKDVIVSANSGAKVDFAVQVGGATETVEVTGEAPQLQTDRADVSISFNARAVEDLPLLNRNFTNLELLSPGTQRLTGWSHASTENPQGSQQTFVNGQHFSGTGYMLDGTDNQDPILGIIVINPNLDSVTETKISSETSDAEFGKALGGIVTAQTKSGSNELHGSGFYFNRNKAGLASDPFSTGVPNNTWKQYGGSVGGAIIKNKLFFFGDYQGTRRSAGTSYTGTVPTDLVRNTCLNPDPAATTCNLSEYLGAGLSGGGQVYNANQALGSRTAYPGNIIPKTDLSATALSILSLLPAANKTASANSNGTLNNYTANGSGSFNDYGFNTRIDFAASQKLQVFGRYSYAHFLISGAPVYGAKIGGSGFGQGGLAGQSLIKNQSLAAGFDYTLSNSLLTDFRLGWFKYNPHSTKFDQGNATAASALGLTGLNIASDPSTNGLPGFFFDGTQSSFGEALNISRCNCPLTESEWQLQFVNNWTKTHGNHTFKFGVDLRHASNLRTPSDANRTGQLTFSHLGTENCTLSGGKCASGSDTGGLDLATFLFGKVSSFNRYVGSPGELSATETQGRYFFYGQDSWRITSKLTLNYGLRWEIYTPEAVNGKAKGGFAVLPEGVIRVAGYGGISNNGSTKSNYKNFAPRLGLAYQMNPKTVVRMGYGRSFDVGVFGTVFGHTVTQNLPVLANQNLGGGDNKGYAFNFAAGPADPQSAFPAVPSSGILPFRGPTGSVTPNVRADKINLPTVDTWNVTVQRQLDNKTSMDVAYIGNKGTHTFQGNGPSFNVNTATVAGFANGLSYDARRPYNGKFTYADWPGVVCCSGDINYFGWASNNYRALQVKVDRRMSQGLQFLAHYTYSRAYNHDGNYPVDPNVVYGRDDYNRNSVFVLTAVYELPMGKGKKFFGNISRAADAVIGGWQWNSTWTLGSGLPFTPSYSDCNADRDTGPCRPDGNGTPLRMKSGKFNPVSKSVQYFTPLVTVLQDPAHPNDPTKTVTVSQMGGYTLPISAQNPTGKVVYSVAGACASVGFCRPQVGAFGNVQRNSFTGPGEFMSDMSLFKNFTVTERIKATFRAEFFNVFNHPVYGFSSAQGNTCIDCGSGGVITGLQEGTSMRAMQLGVRVTF